MKTACDKRTQIWSRFQKLRGKGESDGCEIGYTYKPTAPSCELFTLRQSNRTTHFRKMLSRVLNLEPSSGAFSAVALDGVVALELSLELRAETVVEPGWAFSADKSAMASLVCFSSRMERTRI
jgi:hypothetical protein